VRIVPLLFLLALVSACKRNNIHFLQAEGAAFIQNMSTGRSVDADSPFAPIIPVIHGDLLWLPQKCFLKYNDEKDRTIHLSSDKSHTYIDGRLASMIIEDNWKILDTLSTYDLTQLRSVYIALPLVPSCLPALKEISRKKRNVGIVYTDETDTSEENKRDYKSLETLLQLFEPDWLVTYMDAGHINLLTKEPTLDMLYLILDDSVINYKLPHIDKLRHLTLIVDEANIPSDFLDDNPQIADIVVEGDFKSDLFVSLKKVRSIHINTQSALNFDLKEKDALERLTIAGSVGFPAITISTYRNLSWLNLPCTASQAQFDSIAITNPGIKVIEFSGDSLINDLRRAEGWNQLNSMIIYGDTMYQKTGLAELKHLKLLSLPTTAFKDIKKISQLRKALPNTTIIPNNGSCLGSGWLLLLIPLVAILQLTFKTRVFL
jgi:hypothetical protein